MHKAFQASMHLARAVSFTLIGIWLGGAVALSQEITAAVPTLQLEKPVYVAGESVRFWVGVNSEVDIPEAFRSSCILHIVRPDGSRIDRHESWPIDGATSRSWKGGDGIGEQAPSPGRYVVSFEFAGRKTADQAFEIVENPLLRSIEARFVFYDIGSGGIHARAASLHVENRTGRVLRYAKLGLYGSEVWLNVKEFQPPSTVSVSVPRSALPRASEIPSFSFEKLDWGNRAKWPMIALPDGGSADREIALQSAYSFRDGREYEVTIGTVLTVFVGERDDPDAQLFPLRIPVSASERFRR